MTLKPVLRRRQARLDIEAAADYYEVEAGPEVADKFLEAVRASFRAIQRRPGTGSPRYAYELDLIGLRSRPISRFPYLVFYREEDMHIEIWRVLHARSDIPIRLQQNPDTGTVDPDPGKSLR